MELVFGKLYPPKSVPPPQEGEIYLLPAGDATNLATLVYEKGIDALIHGAGPYKRVVIDADAKFDDMLAATFVERIAACQGLPKGAEAFAKYAGLFREGQRPGNFPLENSLEGVFLAMRCRPKKPLTDPETGHQFLGDWQRLGSMIIKAAEQNSNPFTTPLLNLLRGEESVYGLDTFNPAFTQPRQLNAAMEFSPEREFLKQDLAVYRNDVAHGKKWDIRVKGGPPKAKGLLLDQPQSVLFKYWTRSQCPPPVGGPFAFVATTFWHGQWVLAIDPRHAISLQPLAEKLQAAEKANDAKYAEENPWFDGKPTGYQVVAAPRAGTLVPDAQVEKIVCKWCRARKPGVSMVRTMATSIAGCLTLAIMLALVMGGYSSANREPLKVHELIVLSIGVSDYESLPDLPVAATDADDLKEAFDGLAGSPVCTLVKSKVVKDEKVTRSNILENWLGTWLLNEAGPTEHSLVVVTFSGHGLTDKNKRYFFAPYDYEKGRFTTGISYAEVQDCLDRLPCASVVIFDTCHSGAAAGGQDDDAEEAIKSLKDTVRDARGRTAVLTACDTGQKANETMRWKHGALTLALLEGMQQKTMYFNKRQPLPEIEFPKPSPDGRIFLNELSIYVNKRVTSLCRAEIADLANKLQKTRTFCTGNITLEQIPIAAATAR